MYVCICNAVTESTVRAAACAGIRDLDSLAMSTGCGTGCGCCRQLAAEMLTELASPASSN